MEKMRPCVKVNVTLSRGFQIFIKTDVILKKYQDEHKMCVIADGVEFKKKTNNFDARVSTYQEIWKKMTNETPNTHVSNYVFLLPQWRNVFPDVVLEPRFVEEERQFYIFVHPIGHEKEDDLKKIPVDHLARCWDIVQTIHENLLVLQKEDEKSEMEFSKKKSQDDFSKNFGTLIIGGTKSGKTSLCKLLETTKLRDNLNGMFLLNVFDTSSKINESNDGEIREFVETVSDNQTVFEYRLTEIYECSMEVHFILFCIDIYEYYKKPAIDNIKLDVDRIFKGFEKVRGVTLPPQRFVFIVTMCDKVNSRKREKLRIDLIENFPNSYVYCCCNEEVAPGYRSCPFDVCSGFCSTEGCLGDSIPTNSTKSATIEYRCQECNAVFPACQNEKAKKSEEKGVEGKCTKSMVVLRKPGVFQKGGLPKWRCLTCKSEWDATSYESEHKRMLEFILVENTILLRKELDDLTVELVGLFEQLGGKKKIDVDKREGDYTEDDVPSENINKLIDEKIEMISNVKRKMLVGRSLTRVPIKPPFVGIMTKILLSFSAILVGSAVAGLVGWSPIPFTDTGMCFGISMVWGATKGFLKSVLQSLKSTGTMGAVIAIVGFGGWGIGSVVKAIPGIGTIVGGVINMTVAILACIIIGLVLTFSLLLIEMGVDRKFVTERIGFIVKENLKKFKEWAVELRDKKDQQKVAREMMELAEKIVSETKENEKMEF